MRMVIIPSDTFCAINNVGYTGVDMSSVPPSIHAVQWFGVEGWIEYKNTPEGKPENQTITSIEMFQGVIDSWTVINDQHINPPAPQPNTPEQNKALATGYLENTDWTQLPSVADPALSTPHLTNADEFALWRSEIRDIAMNPPAGDVNWPTQPTPIWA